MAKKKLNSYFFQAKWTSAMKEEVIENVPIMIAIQASCVLDAIRKVEKCFPELKIIDTWKKVNTPKDASLKC